MRTSSCFGILLAGGLARRMGGGDKALRELGGTSLLARAIAALRPQCEGLVLSANGDPEQFAGFDLPIVADDVPGFMGPLAGILAGLDWIAAHRPDVALAISAPADTPFLPGDLAARLMDARAKGNALIACARSGGRTHQAVAVWPVSMRIRSPPRPRRREYPKGRGILAKLQPRHCGAANPALRSFLQRQRSRRSRGGRGNSRPA